jgi:hypothetical protein
MTMTREEALTIVTSIVREHSRECREPKPCQDCELEAEAIAALSAQEPVSPWRPIETAPRDGSEVWAYNGEQARMKWIEGDGYALWVWADDLLSEVDAAPEQPTYFMPLPAPPALHQLGAKVEVSS